MLMSCVVLPAPLNMFGEGGGGVSDERILKRLTRKKKESLVSPELTSLL